MNRRTFLIQAGAGGAAILSSGAWLSAESGAAPALADRLATLVAELEIKFPYAFALYTRDESLTLEVSDDGNRLTTTGPNEGIVAGIWDGGMMREEATSMANDAGIRRLRDRLLAFPAPLSKSVDMDPGPPIVTDLTEAGRIPIDSRSLTRRLDDLASLRAAVTKRSPALAMVRLESLQGSSERLFVNRTRRLYQKLSRAGIGGVAMARKGSGRPGFLFIRHRGIGGLEHVELSGPVVDRWVERTERLAGALPPEAGEMTVVTEPNVTGVVAHESFGHGVELDMFVKGRARAAAFIDKPVGSAMVNITDDPTRAGAWGFYHFDDEGWTAAPTRIIENGIFRRGLSDSFSARASGLPRTANGRRESWDHKAYARMSNIFFEPGQQTREELIRGVTKGLLVGHFSSGIEDPKGWGMQVVCQYGEVIENGRLTGRVVAPVTLSGYVPDVLGSVDGVANDLELPPGTCGKGYKEFVPVSSGGPTIRFKARVS
ncbi:MAG: TldD/PmbA family protein [Candidatus Eisenbacteria bacterium]|nr:TldD/PmbA family protein [Candidatus Eisenbacteria bacterium]